MQRNLSATAAPKEYLNPSQKLRLEQFLNFSIELLEDDLKNHPSLMIMALNALKGDETTKDNVAMFAAMRLWSAIVQIRDIYRHPCPHHSTEAVMINDKKTKFAQLKVPRNAIASADREGLTLKNGREIEKKDILLDDESRDYIIAKEYAGLLNLTTHELSDSTTLPVTKKAVVNFLKQKIAIKIAEYNDKLIELAKEGKSESSFTLPKNITEQDQNDDGVLAELTAQKQDSGVPIHIDYFFSVSERDEAEFQRLNQPSRTRSSSHCSCPACSLNNDLIRSLIISSVISMFAERRTNNAHAPSDAPSPEDRPIHRGPGK